MYVRLSVTRDKNLVFNTTKDKVYIMDWPRWNGHDMRKSKGTGSTSRREQEDHQLSAVCECLRNYMNKKNRKTINWSRFSK